MRRFVMLNCATLSVGLALVVAIVPTPAVAQSVAPSAETDVATKNGQESTFLRITRDDDDQPIALQTAIVSYVPTDGTRRGLQVDLIGAVHIADGKYYAKLNKLFATYDAVLYELVAPEGTRVPKGGGGSTSTVSVLQSSMTRMLDLKFQLEAIDYTRTNLVHADLSPEEFSRSMRDRGESFVQVFFRMLGHAMAQEAKNPGDTSDIRLLSALFAKDRAYQLKCVMAEQFEDLEATAKVFEGPQGSTLVTVRNQRAIDVLEREVAGGRKKLAIFYGAAHMPDMKNRMMEQLKLGSASRRWITAWDLSKGEKP